MAILSLFSRRKPADCLPAFDINQLRVAAPCPARWEDMVGDERTRHCAECNLNVYNFSAMAADEVQKLVAASRTNGSRLCARFYRRTDGTVLTQDCPRGLRVAVRRLAKVSAAVLAAMMSVSFAAAKTSQQSCSVRSATAQKSPGIWLQIMDPQGAVLPNAQIEMTDKSGKKTFAGATSSTGELSFTNLPSGDYTLTIEARGFRTFTRAITVRNAQVLEVRLKLAIAEAKTEIEVTAGAVLVQGTVGIVTTTDNPNLPAAAGRSQPAPMRQ